MVVVRQISWSNIELGNLAFTEKASPDNYYVIDSYGNLDVYDSFGLDVIMRAK
jgi:hypothetical protein